MKYLYILNESKTLDIPGDVKYYKTLDELISSIEAIDVRNDEFFAFVSDGRRIRLSAVGEYSPVIAKIEKSPEQREPLQKLLFRDLVRMSKHPNFDMDLAVLKAAETLDDLVKLIPINLVTKGP